MVRNRQFKRRKSVFWTKDRVILGLRRFYKDFGFCPASTEEYSERQQFTGKVIDGRISTKGYDSKYPSMYAILNHFGSMREAWTAAGYDVNKWWQEWSPMEDWFILESVGILPRSEVAELLKRTEPAIKRRIYDLGRINSKNRWGLTVSRAAGHLGIGGHVIHKYLEYGFIPFFRGNKCIYLNPADLFVIKEIDWTKFVFNSEFEPLMRRALMQRAVKIIKFGAGWRSHEIYKFHKTKEYLGGKIRNPRRSAFAGEIAPAPNDLQIGDWVKVKFRINQVDESRHGVIKAIHYSPQKKTRADGTNRVCWMAHVEFPKLKRAGHNGTDRIKYTLPLDALEITVPPEIVPVPLKMTPEAVRSRKRRSGYIHRAGDRLNEIKTELT